MGDERRTVYTGMRPSGKLDKKASKILREEFWVRGAGNNIQTDAATPKRTDCRIPPRGGGASQLVRCGFFFWSGPVRERRA